MQLSRSSQLFLVPVLALALGCDKTCKKTVEDFATIQNLTGRSAGLVLCKGANEGLAQITLPEDSLPHVTSLGKRDTIEVRGGPSAKCGSEDGGSTSIRVFLSPSSFGQYKLCYDEVNQTNVILNLNQSCPTGSLEQTETAPCKTQI